MHKANTHTYTSILARASYLAYGRRQLCQHWAIVGVLFSFQETPCEQAGALPVASPPMEGRPKTSRIIYVQRHDFVDPSLIVLMTPVNRFVEDIDC
jgi:hypothetical protein